MNRNQLIWTVMLAVGLAAGRAANAQPVCDRTFDPHENEQPVNSGDWHDPDNWDPPSVPDATKVACIPPGKMAVINDQDAEAKALWIKRDGEDIGVVYQQTDSEIRTLTIYADSTFDGELVVYRRARLLIDGDLTFEGVGGGINMYSPTAFLRIEGADANSKLTIQPGPGGDNSKLSKTFCIWGGGTIDVELVNNAQVVASDPSANLVVNKPATGDGRWQARQVNSDSGFNKGGPGTLVIDAVVGGGGRWRLSQSGGEIVFNVSPSNLTGEISLTNGLFTVNTEFDTAGDVKLSGVGALEINQDFVSTGKLSMTGNSKVRVDNGAIAQFDGP